LSAADIIDLRDAGVTDKVVNYMIDTQNTVGANTAAASTVVVQQPPPPLPVKRCWSHPDRITSGSVANGSGRRLGLARWLLGTAATRHAVWVAGRAGMTTVAGMPSAAIGAEISVAAIDLLQPPRKICQPPW